MKCINNKKRVFCLFAVCAVGLALSACGKQAEQITDAYETYACEPFSSGDTLSYFANELCVGQDIEAGKDELADADLSKTWGVFSLSDGTIPYSKNIYNKRYPASTTKIMTAYLALKYGNLQDMLTVSEKAGNPSSDSSICGIQPGDKLTLEQTLYGLLLVSGNDAATAIAEYISGDEASFADLMNKEANQLGATRSHFVNPHGLHNKDHYTCGYDLYLIFSEAIKNETFLRIISTPVYHASYKDKNGLTVTRDWNSTDQFLTGLVNIPDGVDVYGGKTGTTSEAGNCLILYSKNKKGKDIISLVLKANGTAALYQLMGQLLAL